MKKNILILLLVIVFSIMSLVGCSSGSNNEASSSSSAESSSIETSNSGAEALKGKKVFMINSSMGFAATDKTIAEIEQVAQDDSPLIEVSKEGTEIDEKGVIFVFKEGYEPADGASIYIIDGVSSAELASSTEDTFPVFRGEIETTYGKVNVYSQ